LLEFFIRESPGSPEWDRAALTMDLNNADASVLNVTEDPSGAFAEVTVKLKVPREYAENFASYSEPSKTRRGRRKP
jgi:hypothetical protein